jgi:GAF domain-containing protein
MSEIEINTNQSENEIYENCSVILEHLIVPSDKLISNLSNYISLLKQSFSKISWVGFYIVEKDKLFLGPFQGNSACSEILVGKGVCGTSAIKKETIIVQDVSKFPGHIACDSKSQSEIVVPIIINNQIWGVLDIDSYKKNAFSELDKSFLEEQIKFMIQKLDLIKFILT